MNPSRLINAILLSIFLSGTASCQSGKFLIKEDRDSVTISYKWKRYGLVKKDKPLCLVLRLTNYNPDRVQVSFHVDYYWKAIRKESSEEVTYCIRPESRIQGKMWDLVFSSGEFSEDRVLDKGFLWELGDLAISHDAECRTRLNIKIKPDARAMNHENPE